MRDARRLARLGDDWIDRYEAGEFASVRPAHDRIRSDGRDPERL